MADNNLVLMQHATKAAASFSHDGESFDSDDNGIISVPAELTDFAKDHGFSTDIAEDKPVRVLAKGADGSKGGKKGKGGKADDADETEGADGSKGGE